MTGVAYCTVPNPEARWVRGVRGGGYSVLVAWVVRAQVRVPFALARRLVFGCCIHNQMRCCPCQLYVRRPGVFYCNIGHMELPHGTTKPYPLSTVNTFTVRPIIDNRGITMSHPLVASHLHPNGAGNADRSAALRTTMNVQAPSQPSQIPPPPPPFKYLNKLALATQACTD